MKKIKIPRLKKLQIIALVVVVVLIVILVLWIKAKKKKDEDEGEDENNDVNLIEAADNNIQISNLTLTSAQFESLCVKLLAAMKGLGTDEDAIYEAFDVLGSYSDVQFLVKTFGRRSDKTLPEWISSELSTKEVATLNGILLAKSIHYSF